MTFPDGIWNLRRVGIQHSTILKKYLNKFNQVIGNIVITDVKAADLENHQVKRQKQGLKPKTVDDELSYGKTMVIEAFDNDVISGNALSTFNKVNRLLRKNSNKRDRVLTVQEFKVSLMTMCSFTMESR